MDSTRCLRRPLLAATPRRPASLLPRTFSCPSSCRPLSTAPSSKPAIKIVEVGPRDGLQNEKKVLPTELKVELIRRLVEVGLNNVESGSFVSPKWVPQMASTTAVLSSPILHALRARDPTLSLPVLVPNTQGLTSLLALLNTPSPLSSAPAPPPITDEIAVFISASEGFSRANLNCSIAQSLERLEPVVKTALEIGLKVRGYVSVVVGCPFEGRVEPGKVREVAKALVEMGCYEISLGDTIGVGTPESWREMVHAVGKSVNVSLMAAHCHDSYGTGVANVLAAVDLGIRTIDSSISGLGGCPYSPGATGNVATEDVIYALESSGFSTGVLPLPKPGARWDDLLETGERASRFEGLAEVGGWVSEEVGRANGSRAGVAVLARRERRKKMEGK